MSDTKFTRRNALMLTGAALFAPAILRAQDYPMPSDEAFPANEPVIRDQVPVRRNQSSL